MTRCSPKPICHRYGTVISALDDAQPTNNHTGVSNPNYSTPTGETEGRAPIYTRGNTVYTRPSQDTAATPAFYDRGAAHRKTCYARPTDDISGKPPSGPRYDRVTGAPPKAPGPYVMDAHRGTAAGGRRYVPPADPSLQHPEPTLEPPRHRGQPELITSGEGEYDEVADHSSDGARSQGEAASSDSAHHPFAVLEAETATTPPPLEPDYDCVDFGGVGGDCTEGYADPTQDFYQYDRFMVEADDNDVC